MRGLEPPRSLEHQDLNLTRIPISPHTQMKEERKAFYFPPPRILHQSADWLKPSVCYKVDSFLHYFFIYLFSNKRDFVTERVVRGSGGTRTPRHRSEPVYSRWRCQLRFTLPYFSLFIFQTFLQLLITLFYHKN